MTGIKRIAVLAAVLSIIPVVYAETEGEKLFKSNRPADAVPLLESDIASGTASPDAYNYLGLAYYQTGQFEKSEETFEKGLTVPGTNKKILAYNAGNAAYAGSDYAKSVNYYSLALAASPDFTPAVLNRANAELKQDKLSDALKDYSSFVRLVPDDPQTAKINQMIMLIREELEKRSENEKIAAEQEKKRQEEEAALKAEQDRIAAQKAADEAEKKAAEEERRRKLLEDVANSLQDTSTENMTSGTESTINYDSEPELD
ncbi:MAG: tetratricopeptide repeat protein [Treponema sp.]|nr:tetratricopeptide repeat protein [Treponema sp.]